MVRAKKKNNDDGKEKQKQLKTIKKFILKMPLKLYNTLTRKKEAFKPIKANFVSMYTCGPNKIFS